MKAANYVSVSVSSFLSEDESFEVIAIILKVPKRAPESQYIIVEKVLASARILARFSDKVTGS
jgi:hypothetical protein